MLSALRHRRRRFLLILSARWQRRAIFLLGGIAVIVTEMTNNHAMPVPLMLASLIACSTSRLICPTGVYHALAENFLRRAPASGTDGSRLPG